MKFVWTTLQVRDLDMSLAFYHDLLGLPLHERFQAGPNEIAMLGTPEGTKLELICKKDPMPEVPGGGVSMGFASEDLPALIQKLTERGVPVPPPVSPKPDLVFYFIHDPDGYTVQLL